MKKLFLFLGFVMATVCSAVALNAEDLIGKWQSNQIKQETPGEPLKMDLKINYVFSEGQKVETKQDCGITIMLDKGINADIFIKLEAQGTYTVDADSVSCTYDVNTLKVSFKPEDVRVRGIDDADMVSQIEEQLYTGFSQNIEAMKEGFEKPDVLNSVMIVGKKMTCKYDDQFVTFKRK